jgi:hypothetical protein
MMMVMRGFGGVALLVCLLGIGCGEVESRPPVNDDAAQPDTPLPPIDASIDAPPDGPAKATQFAVGFINKFTIGWSRSSAGMLSFVVIANKGTMPLNLTKVAVVKVEDDDPMINSVVAVETPSELSELTTDRAAGTLGPPAYARLFEGGVMTEAYDSTDTLDFAMRFSQSEALIGKTLNLQATIQINDAEAILPITIKFVESPTLLIDDATRVSSR